MARAAMRRPVACDASAKRATSYCRARIAKVADSGPCAENSAACEVSNPLPNARLDSWKSIAEYLKRSPRTVQRWHADFGLPVHHFGGGRGPVFCYSDELDAWLLGFEESASGVSVAVDEFLAARKAKSIELTARAGELWELRTEENLEAVSALYRRAIDQDPANGAAFIGIANSLILSALIGGLRGAAAYPRAAEAVKRAQRLGPEGPAARCAAAWLEMAYERNWKRAREGFELALKHQPRSSHALCGRALLCIAEGNLAEAARLLRDAWEQDAFASTAATFLAWVQCLAGDFDQALATIADARASGEDGAAMSAVECFALLRSGSGESQVRRIEAIAAAHPRCLVLQGALGWAWAAAERTGEARDVLNNLKRIPGGCPYAMALVLCALGEKYAAVSCLETSYAEGSLWSLGFRSDPLLRTLRDDAQVASRLRRLGPQE